MFSGSEELSDAGIDAIKAAAAQAAKRSVEEVIASAHRDHGPRKRCRTRKGSAGTPCSATGCSPERCGGEDKGVPGQSRRSTASSVRRSVGQRRRQSNSAGEEQVCDNAGGLSSSPSPSAFLSLRPKRRSIRRGHELITERACVAPAVVLKQAMATSTVNPFNLSKEDFIAEKHKMREETRLSLHSKERRIEERSPASQGSFLALSDAGSPKKTFDQSYVWATPEKDTKPARSRKTRSAQSSGGFNDTPVIDPPQSNWNMHEWIAAEFGTLSAPSPAPTRDLSMSGFTCRSRGNSSAHSMPGSPLLTDNPEIDGNEHTSPCNETRNFRLLLSPLQSEVSNDVQAPNFLLSQPEVEAAVLPQQNATIPQQNATKRSGRSSNVSRTSRSGRPSRGSQKLTVESITQLVSATQQTQAKVNLSQSKQGGDDFGFSAMASHVPFHMDGSHPGKSRCRGVSRKSKGSHENESAAIRAVVEAVSATPGGNQRVNTIATAPTVVSTPVQPRRAAERRNCIARVVHSGELVQCGMRAKPGVDFCGNHLRTTPHGCVGDSTPVKKCGRRTSKASVPDIGQRQTDTDIETLTTPISMAAKVCSVRRRRNSKTPPNYFDAHFDAFQGLEDAQALASIDAVLGKTKLCEPESTTLACDVLSARTTSALPILPIAVEMLSPSGDPLRRAQ